MNFTDILVLLEYIVQLKRVSYKKGKKLIFSPYITSYSDLAL